MRGSSNMFKRQLYIQEASWMKCERVQHKKLSGTKWELLSFQENGEEKHDHEVVYHLLMVEYM
jgi:hypothetical protein